MVRADQFRDIDRFVVVAAPIFPLAVAGVVDDGHVEIIECLINIPNPLGAKAKICVGFADRSEKYAFETLLWVRFISRTDASTQGR